MMHNHEHQWSILQTYFTHDHHPFLKPNIHAASCSSFFFLIFFFLLFSRMILIFKLSLFLSLGSRVWKWTQTAGKETTCTRPEDYVHIWASKIQSTKPKMVLSSFPGASEGIIFDDFSRTGRKNLIENININNNNNSDNNFKQCKEKYMEKKR